ncbi:DoxX family protein, partial [Rhizobium ruizarguesonis]
THHLPRLRRSAAHAYPLPTIMIIAGAIEVITSALMLVGFQTRVAAFIASGEMAAAYFMGHMPYGFWPALNMGEVAILFCF